jgi:hypothetical protein
MALQEVAANRNTNLAVIGCTLRIPTNGGDNGVKVSQTNGVFVLGNTFLGVGRESLGDAVDLVAVTNSELGWNEVTGVPTHAASSRASSRPVMSFAASATFVPRRSRSAAPCSSLSRTAGVWC